VAADRRLIAVLVALVVVSGCSPLPTSGPGSSSTSSPTRTPTSARSSSAPPPAPPTWQLAALPATKPTSILKDVAATDATHAWAVGTDGYNPSDQYNTGVPIVLNWNGTQWSPAQLPALPWKGGFQLVAAGSATDVWVVGGPMSHDINDIVTIVLRYDGTTWREVPFPAGATPSTMSITDLSVVDGHAWLVGHRGTAVVILEWTGQTWQEHRPPTECVQGGPSFDGMPNFCNVTAIKAFAANDIWAAGNGAWTGFLGPLLYHYDGTTWRAVQVGVNQQKLALQAIDGRSGKDIWAVGDTLVQGGGTLAVHGDGTTWQVVSGLPAKKLPGVAVDTSGNPWLIQNTTAPSANLSTYRATGGWADTPAPTPPDTVGMSLYAITAIPGTNQLLAVGAADLPTDPRLLQAVTLRYASPR
jgi:hypothetical protein